MSASSRPATASRSAPWWKSTELGLIAAIIVVLGLIYVIAPGRLGLFNFAWTGTSTVRDDPPFFNAYNIRTLCHTISLHGVLAIGVAVVIIAGGIDLSIGSIVALSAVVAAQSMTTWLPEIRHASPATTGLLVALAVTLSLSDVLRVGRGRGARPLIFGTPAVVLIAAGVWIAGSARDPGSYLMAGFASLSAIAMVFWLRRGADDRAGANAAGIAWGIAAGVIAGGREAGGTVAIFALLVASTSLALLVGLAMGLRRSAVVLAAWTAMAIGWGLTTAGGPDGEVGPGLFLAAVTLSLLLGMAIGVGHAFLINSFHLPPFIATLATMAGLRSLALILSGNRSITLPDDSVRVLGMNFWVTVILFLSFTAVLSALMRWTVLGRHLYALGGSEPAARLSGLPTKQLKTIAYAISGLLAALGGLFFMGYTGQAVPTMGMTYELFAITAAVVGGCSLSGGLGSIRGTVLGLILIQIVIKGTGLVVRSVDPSQIEGMVLGVVVVVAVGFNQRFRVKS